MSNHLDNSNIDHWIRVTRGKELQFFATDQEVEAWLNHALPPLYSPYQLIGVDKVQVGQTYVEYPFYCEVGSLLECMKESVAPRYNFWIWSKKLTPKLSLTPATNITRLLSFQGLVLLQHGMMLHDRTDPTRLLRRAASRIAIVDRIKNIVTGQIIRHDGYLEIYRALYNVISKALVYSSLVRFPDGHIEEDTRLQRMTEGAVRSYEAGYPLMNKPGRLLVARKTKDSTHK